ncbi:D-serine ammonia-lyase [Brevibacterium sanguinis]|uniref:Probable D-serine dehydratase n=2 Tax=Brevibacterium TaxID=1696 RepID=A0A366ILW3_9MICO|nr:MULTISPECIES: D-serine ammonia-lyase [Brevibacterium]RBP67192.1 D-serine ammonia-lyase [Brevibacterium sanguinis]RBP73717.1 D-serine ammonia-lyase [Brevibacterium celere]
MSADEQHVTVDTDDEVIAALAKGVPITWFRPGRPRTAEVMRDIAVDESLMGEAAARFERFAPWFASAFPETAEAQGILESPLVAADAARREIDDRLGVELPGQLWLKRDDALPVSGSIKARGGFHEVLEYAEAVAVEGGMDAHDPATYASDEFRERAAAHHIVVGSTGNLGLSIGILSAALGFAATVHMSADAREWKKEKLRSHGVEVIEYEGDFAAAVEAGRASAEGVPRTHFVDDEDSVSLFAGYSVAALRLKEQFAERGEPVDADHQLVVYLPCGIGGSPGGVTYGLKRVFGDAVHCVFVEPTAVPAMVLGVRTGRHHDIAVQDIGLSGQTAADGLAVARPSRFVGPVVDPLISAFATVSDDIIRAGVGVLAECEGLEVEPSAAAGLTVPWRAVIAEASVRDETGVRDEADGAAEVSGPSAAGVPWPLDGSTNHLVWLTGGAMVPVEERRRYVTEGVRLMSLIGDEDPAPVSFID